MEYNYKGYTVTIKQLDIEGAKMMGQPNGTFTGCLYKDNKRVWVADRWDYLFSDSLEDLKDKMQKRADYIINTPNYPKPIIDRLLKGKV